MLSIIVPAYNEEQMIPITERTISELMEKERIPYELMFVNDGSKDGTWREICKAAERNINVVGVNFSRNFGKEAAMFAGLEKASGDCCVMIDCDLQHPPEKIVEMYRLWQLRGGRGRKRGSRPRKRAARLFLKRILRHHKQGHGL